MKFAIYFLCCSIFVFQADLVECLPPAERGLIGDLTNAVGNATGNLLGGLGDTVGNVVGGVGDLVDGLADGAVDTVNGIACGALGLVNGVLVQGSGPCKDGSSNGGSEQAGNDTPAPTA